MTIKNKRIKTLWMSYGKNLIAGYQDYDVVGDIHIWQDDITLIGFMLHVFVRPEAELDSGYISVEAELNVVGKKGADGALGEITHRIQGRSVTVGINATEVVLQEGDTDSLFMFPEGYGVDFDEKDPIYLMVSHFNSMANQHTMDCSCILYYVER